MKIDIEHVIGLGLSPDEYIYLLLIHQGKCEEYIERGLRLRIDRKSLEVDGYIKIHEEGVVVRPRFIDLVEDDFDRQFSELLSTYPMKVGTAGKLRSLHAADPNAKANVKIKVKYRTILAKDPALHRKIIKLLNVQLKHQRGSLQYLNALDVWLNQSMWEKWEGMDENTDDDERNTRILD